MDKIQSRTSSLERVIKRDQCMHGITINHDKIQLAKATLIHSN